jgi:hypothetical protein
MDELEIQGIIAMIENQRNAALTQAAQMAGKLTVYETRIKELEKKLADAETPESAG